MDGGSFQFGVRSESGAVTLPEERAAGHEERSQNGAELCETEPLSPERRL
jgi:hypothetical protein